MDKYPNYISQEKQEEFEKYLLGNMHPEQETLFQQKLEANTELYAQFNEFKTLFSIIEEDGLRNALDDFHKDFEKKSTSKKSIFNRYNIAAGVAVLISLGFWFLNQPTQGEKLFEEYFSPDPGLPTVMGSNNNYDFYEAMVDYKQGHYDVAIRKWKKLLVQKPENDTLNYFLGVAHLANDNPEVAISFLEYVNQLENSEFKKDNLFFLGMSYLKKGETGTAIKILKEINSEKSRAIIKEIDQ